ncbi:Uncharacterised protein [Mycobacteroides abscessus subsp. abscessus]|nr:Uncharacterised protein [Mycobacteroides abscessus subsp. abscessus]
MLAAWVTRPNSSLYVQVVGDSHSRPPLSSRRAGLFACCAAERASKS